MEEILDEQYDLQPTPPLWPSVIMGGLTGGGLLVLFNLITRKGGAVIVIYLITIFIVQNSTLNHYRGKTGSNKSFGMAFNLCFATYVLMIATNFMITYLWLNHDITFSLFQLLVSFKFILLGLLGAGLLISALTAFLSQRPNQV